MYIQQIINWLPQAPGRSTSAQFVFGTKRPKRKRTILQQGKILAKETSWQRGLQKKLRLFPALAAAPPKSKSMYCTCTFT